MKQCDSDAAVSVYGGGTQMSLPINKLINKILIYHHTQKVGLKKCLCVHSEEALNLTGE